MTPTEAKIEAKKDLYLLRDRPWREIDQIPPAPAKMVGVLLAG